MGDAASFPKEAESARQKQEPEDAGAAGAAPPPPTSLKISEPTLLSFPSNRVFDLGSSLEHLDLSGNPNLSSLPPDLGSHLPKLKRAFFSGCGFETFPSALASCPALEMVAFRGNGMRTVPEGCLPPRLRWLILTDNAIGALPRDIGRCERLRKCMLAGNQLEALPDDMAGCRRLGLLRLAANCFRALPEWLFELPELAFLSFAGNPCCRSRELVSGGGGTVSSVVVDTTAGVAAGGATATELGRVSWASLVVEEVLGEGASGIISRGTWDNAGGDGNDDGDDDNGGQIPSQQQQQQQQQQQHVAIKLFKGGVTSDGTPADEMRACIQAGAHPNLIDPLGRVHDHPDGAEGLIMQLIPAHYRALGLPPSFQSCTRDCFAEGPGAAPALRTAQGLSILRGIASAAAHVHERGVAHGDLYAHNILFDDEGHHALLGDFGAASTYHRYIGNIKGHATTPHDHFCQPPENNGDNYDDDEDDDSHDHHAQHRIEQLEVLAFAHLIEDVWRLIRAGLKFDEDELRVSMRLAALHRSCATPTVADRPKFSEVHRRLCEIGG